MPFVADSSNLPRSLDVQISLSMAQTELRTDLSILCVAMSNLGFIPNSNRIRFYSTLSAVEQDFNTSTDAYFAALAFFSQTPIPTTMAIGEVYSNSLPAQIIAGELSTTEIAAIKVVSDGSMNVHYNLGAGDTILGLSALNFTAINTVEDIAAVITTAIGINPLTCTVKTLPGGSKRLDLSTIATGSTVLISEPVTFGTGTFIAAMLNMTAATGATIIDGYTYVGIADELASIAAAAKVQGKYIYGWCLGSTLRVAATQEAAAAWALGQIAMMPLVTNDSNALNPAYTTDIGSVIKATGNRRAPCLYHDNPQMYPDVSILAYMLSVNYRLPDSTVTAKFKQLPGISTVTLTQTQWGVLQSKGYNSYTAIGNNSRTYRDGTTEDTAWYMDTVINLDNFVEDLSVNVFNVFLRTKKVPYTRHGQMMLVDACKDTGNQYVYNGTFADREVEDLTQKSGVSILPAVQITPTPISQMSAADRAARIGPPIQLTCQDAGAIHSIAINVEVVS